MSCTIIRSVPLGVLILGFVSATLLGADSAEESAAERARRAAYVLEKAEEARAAGKEIAATILYKDALARYSSLTEKYPEWEPEVVRLRLVYCNEQLQGLLEPKKSVNEGPQSLPQASPVLEKTPPVPKHEVHDSTDPRVGRIVALVKRLIISGATEEARTKLIEGLRIDPDDAALRLLIGIVQCRAGNYADAAYVLETLLEEQPQNAPAHVALGVAYAGLSRTADAERQNLTALELNPRLAEVCYNLTRLLLLKEPPDLQSAHRYYLKALELGAQPDEEVEEALGLFYPAPHANQPTTAEAATQAVEGSANP